MTRSGFSGMSTLTVAITGRAEAPQRCKNRRRSGRPLELNFRFLLIRGPRIIAVASNPEHLWSEQHGIKTRTKRNHSRTNSGRLTIGGNYSRSPDEVICQRLVDKRLLTMERAKVAVHARCRCEYCDLEFLKSAENYRQWQWDHIIPKESGGIEGPEN